MLLNNQIRARGFFRLFYLPVVTPLVIAAIIWKWVYNGDFGLLNYYLIQLGIIDEPLLWLADPNLAMPAVIITSVWKSVGFSMVVYLAGLQSIPEDFYDAAKVDGAVGWQRLKDITIPLLSSTTLFLAVVSVLGAFQVFTEIFIMTNGGPLGRTTTIVYHIYQTAFKFFDMGYASAMAFGMFAMMFAFTLVQLGSCAARWSTSAGYRLLAIGISRRTRRPGSQKFGSSMKVENPKAGHVKAESRAAMAVMARERRLVIPRERVRGPDWRGMAGKAIVYAVLIIVGALFVAPFVWMVSGSVQEIGDIFRWPPQWIPRNPTLDNYARFFEYQRIGRFFLNSAYVAIAVTFLQLLISSLAAYAFAKRNSPPRCALR